jgi:hypothetical protein
VLWPDLPTVEMVHRVFPIEHCMDAVSCVVRPFRAAGANRRHTQLVRPRECKRFADENAMPKSYSPRTLSRNAHSTCPV